MRPTLLPEWASSPTNITEPPSASKASGWGINEAPPSSYMNWLQSTTYNWVKYLSYRTVIDEYFARGSSAMSDVVGTNWAPTYLHPMWSSARQTGIRLVYENQTQRKTHGSSLKFGGSFAEGQVMGFSGTNELLCMPGTMLELDASGIPLADELAEINVSLVDFIGATGSYIQVGGIPSGVAVGGAYLVATAPSGGNWNYHYYAYDGIGASGWTGVDLGIKAVSQSSYQRFAIERSGATTTIQCNGSTVAVISGAGSQCIFHSTGLAYSNIGYQSGIRSYRTTDAAAGVLRLFISHFKYGLRY